MEMGVDPRALTSDGMDPCELAARHGSVYFLRAWIAMGLPLPVPERVEDAMEGEAGLPWSDELGRSECRGMLAALALGKQMRSELPDPGPVAGRRPAL